VVQMKTQEYNGQLAKFNVLTWVLKRIISSAMIAKGL
jgi:hypothetical protein